MWGGGGWVGGGRGRWGVLTFHLPLTYRHIDVEFLWPTHVSMHLGQLTTHHIDVFPSVQARLILDNDGDGRARPVSSIEYFQVRLFHYTVSQLALVRA